MLLQFVQHYKEKILQYSFKYNTDSCVLEASETWK